MSKRQSFSVGRQFVQNRKDSCAGSKAHESFLFCANCLCSEERGVLILMLRLWDKGLENNMLSGKCVLGGFYEHEPGSWYPVG